LSEGEGTGLSKLLGAPLVAFPVLLDELVSRQKEEGEEF